MRPLARGRSGYALAAAVVLAHAGLVLLAVRGMPLYSDEEHHLRQIDRFCAGDYVLDPKITTLPGYHAVAALVGRMLGDCSLGAMRAAGAAFGLLSVAAFHATARAAGATRPLVRSLQYYFLPILLPYHFLVHSDSLSLLSVLVAFALSQRGRHAAAGGVAAVGILLRQTNVVWVPLLALVAAQQGGLRKARAYLPAVALFLAFVAVNGGVALGDRPAHQAGFHTGNVFFLLFLFFVLFLPRNLALLWRRRERLLEARLVAVLAASLALLRLSFRVEHPYNRYPEYLRNDLLTAVEAQPLAKAAFFLCVAGALAALYVDRLPRRAGATLAACTLLALVPAGLIEHRYALVSLALFLALRPDDSDRVEAAGLVQSVLLSSVLLAGIVRGDFAL